MDYIVQILRTLFFNIDRVIYAGVGTVYDLLLKISRTTILDTNVIKELYGRIYALIGIFMLFKISFSLITYILNPDEFVDKEKGFASIIKRVIISLVMLVLVPYAFRELYALQTILLEDNTLAALVFGEVNNNNDIDTAGEKMKFILMYTFFHPNYDGLYEDSPDEQIASCAITYEYNADGTVLENNGVFTLNQDCFGKLENDLYNMEGAFGEYWKGYEDLYQTYVQGVARQNFYLIFKHDIAMMEKEDSKGTYLVDYMFPLSTAVGVAVLWVLLIFCIDVAVRSIKLAFYQLIAPVPILSYIDPKSKDGMFNKWLKQVGTTYASLFIRLLALYLAIFIISKVSTVGIRDVVTEEQVTDFPVCVFVIIGVLMFAKQLPKILEDTLGFKGTGDFTLNPLKKMDNMLGGKAIKRVGGAAAAAGVAGTLAAGSNLIGGIASGRGFKSIGSALAGGASAMGRATLGGLKGEKFGKNWASSYGAAMQAKQSRADRKDDGVGWGEMTISKLQQKTGIHTAGEKVKAVSDGLKAVQDDYKQLEQVATGVDDYAKYANKQALAAQSRGDFAMQKLWEGARDDRIQQIMADGGKIVKNSKVKDTDFFNFDPTKSGAAAYSKKTVSATGDVQNSEALVGLANHMRDLAVAMNKAGASINGFGAGVADRKDPTTGKWIQVAEDADIKTLNFKKMKDTAQDSQQGIDYNNQHLQDVDKYGAKKGQK